MTGLSWHGEQAGGAREVAPPERMAGIVGQGGVAGRARLPAGAAAIAPASSAGRLVALEPDRKRAQAAQAEIAIVRARRGGRDR